MDSYIFKFGNGRCFDPDGSVKDRTDLEIAEHNSALAKRDWQQMLQVGSGILYLTYHPSGWEVSTWDGSIKVVCNWIRQSRHNWGLRRMDVWFHINGQRWHGVNIGDNQICRVKRVKN